jgi:hypothetical protein
MSATTHGKGDRKADAGAKGGGHQFGVLLVCFDKFKAARKVRHSLDARLKSQGDALLDTAVVRVDAQHRVSLYDPRRVVQGTLTAALTWGVFGLLSGALKSLVTWAILDAVCGGSWAYYSEHLPSKNELNRVGARLAASFSALATFAGTRDPRSLLKTTATYAPAAASVAAIGDDLTARVLAGTHRTGVTAADPAVQPRRRRRGPGGGLTDLAPAI